MLYHLSMLNYLLRFFIRLLASSSSCSLDGIWTGFSQNDSTTVADYHPDLTIDGSLWRVLSTFPVQLPVDLECTTTDRKRLARLQFPVG